MIVNAYTSILDLLHQNLPTTIHNTLNLAYTAITHTLTPSILTSLLYRIFVLYAATRIIPAARGVSQEFTSELDLDSSEPVLPSPSNLTIVLQINEHLHRIFSRLSNRNIHEPITIHPCASFLYRRLLDVDIRRLRRINGLPSMAMDKHLRNTRIIYTGNAIWRGYGSRNKWTRNHGTLESRIDVSWL